MANNWFKVSAIRLIVINLLVIIYFGVIRTEARKFSPLLVEDDGFRRNNRPAGEFAFFLFIFRFKCLDSRLLIVL